MTGLRERAAGHMPVKMHCAIVLGTAGGAPRTLCGASHGTLDAPPPRRPLAASRPNRSRHVRPGSGSSCDGADRRPPHPSPPRNCERRTPCSKASNCVGRLRSQRSGAQGCGRRCCDASRAPVGATTPDRVAACARGVVGYQPGVANWSRNPTGSCASSTLPSASNTEGPIVIRGQLGTSGLAVTSVAENRSKARKKRARCVRQLQVWAANA